MTNKKTNTKPMEIPQFFDLSENCEMETEETLIDRAQPKHSKAELEKLTQVAKASSREEQKAFLKGCDSDLLEERLREIRKTLTTASIKQYRATQEALRICNIEV